MTAFKLFFLVISMTRHLQRVDAGNNPRENVSLRRAQRLEEFDDAGNCISLACQEAEAAFLDLLDSTATTTSVWNKTSRLLVPLGPNTFFEDPSTLFEGCVEGDMQVKAVATSGVERIGRE
jgi:hypothetical protein